MIKRSLLIIGFIFFSILFGDFLFLTTNSAFIANWGSIIIPSFLMGILWKIILKVDLEGDLRYIVPSILGIVKVILLLASVSNPTLLAIIFMLLIYPFVSYKFIKLGNELIRT